MSLHSAALNGDVKSLNELIARRHDLDDIDNDARTPLLVAIWSGNLDCVRLLLQAKASVNKAERDLWSPIFVAAGRPSSASCVRLLIEHNANVMAKTRDGDTCLHRALDPETIGVLGKMPGVLDLARSHVSL